MDMTTIVLLSTIIGIVGTVSGIVIGWTSKAKAAKRDLVEDTRAETKKDTSLYVDVEYIKRGIDDIRVDQRSQTQKIEGICERVTRVEEVAKSAHRRIDTIHQQLPVKEGE